MRAKSWVKELQRQASPNIVIALSGNKADLASKRMVDFEVSGHFCSYFITTNAYTTRSSTQCFVNKGSLLL